MSALHPLALVYGILAALTHALALVTYRSRMSKDADAVTTMVVGSLGAALLLIFIFGLPKLPLLDEGPLIMLGVSALLWTVGAITELKSLRYLDVSLATILSAVKYLLIAGAGFAIYQEHASALTVLGIIFILGAIFLSGSFKMPRLKKGSIYQVISSCAFAGAISIDKYLVQHMEPELIAICSYLLPGLFALLFFPSKVSAIPRELQHSRGVLLLAPLFLAACYLFFVKGLMFGPLSLMITLEQTTMLWALIFGLVILHERTELRRRVTAAIVCCLGCLLVALG